VAYRKLFKSGFFKPGDTVVLFNTGTGLKYIDVIARALKLDRPATPQSRQIGGIIGPF